MSSALRLTVGQYTEMIDCGAFVRIGKRVELVRGEMREMNPAGPVHDEIVTYLTQWSLSNTLREKVVVRTQCGLLLDELDSQPEPDILWAKSRRYFNEHPSAKDVFLAIEVANSSLDFDLTVKAALYAEASIAEYWIAEVMAESIHVFHSPRMGTYESHVVYTLKETVSPRMFPSAVLNINTLYAR